MTKCNNCRFKAKIDGIVTTGIVSAKDGLNAFLKNEQGYNVGCLTGAGLVDSDNRLITDFEIVPRDPETYQDWQVGDKVKRIVDEFDLNKEVIFRSGDLVICKTEQGVASDNYLCDELFRKGYRLVLTDIEEQIIEEKKKYEPQDGDICFAETDTREQKFIIIYKGNSYSLADLHGTGWKLRKGASWAYSYIRPATDEEKQKLFDAMAKAGKRWNAEKKVVESIQEPEELRAVKSEIKSEIKSGHQFKKGEPVLVRSDYGRDWTAGIYVERSINPDAQFGKYGVTDGRSIIFYRFCIPYNERTMHLLGTTKDYKEEQP